MPTRRTDRPVSRRTVLAGLGVGGLGLILAAPGATAQDATPGVPPASVTPEVDGPIATPAIPPVAQGQVVVAGADIHYEVYGAGEPLVLLHGLLGSSLQFVNQIPAFARHYRVIAIDSRGQGRSTYGDGPITYESMAADVLGVLDHLGIQRTHVVGWSNGGVIGLELALHHPERLDRVVAYGANYTASGVWFDPAAEDMLTAMGEQGTRIYQAISPHPERMDEIVAELFALNPEYTEAQLRSIAVPILILDGEHDELITPDQPTTLAAWIPGARLVLMPGTGHFAMFEQPDEFNRIVLEFLAGEGTATPTS
jgi:pimeloyl-ACP methyl ester carboxylesterase